MATRAQTTMAESLQKMLGDVADMKVLPDADLEFLIQLETVILQKLRAPIDDIMGQNQQAQPQMGAQQSPVAMPGGERVSGIRMEPGMPNMDEFMRSMGGARG
jgi:hypothetical protein